MISQSSIEDVKSRMAIAEVLGRFLSLKKDGAGYVSNCPFHDEKTPSFKISPSKNMYKCFGCGASGDSIEFLMKHDKKTYAEAITYLAEMYNVAIEEENNNEVKKYVRPTFVKHDLSENTVKFFLNRGISVKTLQDLQVTQCNEWMPKAKGVVETICFNYFKGEDLINVKYRAVSDKDFKLSKDAEIIFYNLNSIKESDTVVIVEGEMDCLAVSQSGYKSVLSVPNGAAKGNLKLEYLNNCWEHFEGVNKIILMLDNDEPGLLLRDEMARRFGFDRCYKVEYPKGCKDANDILLKWGSPTLYDTISYATEFPIEGVFSMPEMYEDVRRYYYSGYPVGIKVGISGFDDHLQFMLGQFTTITGIPGSGKSEFTDHIITEAAKNHGWKGAICSFENQPSSLHVTKIMEKFTGKSFAKRFNDEDRINESEFEAAVNFVNEYFYFININKVEATLDGILGKAKELVLRKGIKTLLIDPWNYIEHKQGKGQTETQYTSECLTKIKAFALTHNIHIFLIAHPSKMPKVNGKYEVPTLYSISGSAHFFNKTDNGITVYRNYDTNIVEIFIQKVRYGWLGKIGSVQFTYDTERRRYLPVNNAPLIQQPKPQEPLPNPSAGMQAHTESLYQNNYNRKDWD